MTTKTTFGQEEVAISDKLPQSIDPEGDIGTFELADIIDTKILQSIMEDFYQLTGMLGAVLDISGKVLVAVGWQDICTKFHRCNPESFKNCVESDTILTDNVPEGTFKAYRCKNNMWDMVTPLIVGGRHVGNVFIGQFFYADEVPDVELFRKQARLYGFDEREYMAALDRVPRFSRATVHLGMQFYAKLAGLVSTLSFSMIQQSRMLVERKRVEDVLRASEDRYRRAQAVSHVGSWEYDIQTARFSASDEARRIYGFDLNDANFSTDEVEKCIPEKERVHQALIDLIESNKPYNLEFEIHPRDGADPRMIASIAELKRDEHGAPQKVVGVIQDITKRKRAEEKILQLLAEETESRRTLLSVVEDQQRADGKIRKLNEELEDRVAQRTEELKAANKELEAFSYSVSHDLRAPLRAVDGYTRMLSEDYGPVLDEEGQRICSVISSSAQDMGHLIDDLLSFSRFGRAAINPSVIDMEGMARAIFFELATPEKQERVEFILQPLPEVVGDPTLMRQVWVNLLSNALKFSAKREHPVIEVSASTQDGEILYCVRDNGAGFDMRYANKLFGVFQRLHTVKEFAGTGVGLAIVQRIVVRHGGRVWAEGEVDHGASFYFALKGETEHGL